MKAEKKEYRQYQAIWQKTTIVALRPISLEDMEDLSKELKIFW